MRSSSIIAILSAWARRQVPSLYIRQGPCACIAVYIAVAVLVPSVSIYVAAWVVIELMWMMYFFSCMVPVLTAFRPEDSGVPYTLEEVDRIIDNIVFLLKQDSKLFWMKVSGQPCLSGTVPLSTAKCFVKSLLFMFDDCDCFNDEHHTILVERALNRIEIATCGFLPQHDNKSNNDNDAADSSEIHIPNHIKSWVDDDHLGHIVRSTPLLMILFSQMLRLSTNLIILLFGFRRGHTHSPSGLECWIWTPSIDAPTLQNNSFVQDTSQSPPPLVLLPGAGFGLTSFLPLALFFRKKFSNRKILLYRLPWVEVCRPWVHLPQWSTVMEGMLNGFVEMGIQNCDIDVISHSYGTAVANRLLRELCKLFSIENSDSDRHYPRINYLALLDPIVLGGATTGLSGFLINQIGPDLSFAFCGNRAGFSTKEILDYNPRKYDQCLGGIGVYMSSNDLLVDVSLARHILETHVVPLAARGSVEDYKFVQFCIDPTDNSFHGRWLVEMWCFGVWWAAPCASRCLDLLMHDLNLAYPNKEAPKDKILQSYKSRYDLLSENRNVL